MRIRLAGPDAAVGPAAINAALEAATRIDEGLLAAGAEPLMRAIRAGRVKWRPEPRGQGESFDALDTVRSRGWGDCDDLAPALFGFVWFMV